MYTVGLFEVVVKDKVTDAIGIADVLFPSMIVSWAVRYKNDNVCDNKLIFIILVIIAIIVLIIIPIMIKNYLAEA